MGDVVEAFAKAQTERPDWDGHLLLVGGPDEGVKELRRTWLRYKLPAARFHAAGQVAASEVPKYLAACDACLMPLTWTQHFAYYASPLKLFEYMASGRAILATDLPSFREVLAEGENALFAPPSDPAALASALLRLSDDHKLTLRMGERNRKDAGRYTWAARAERIRAALDKG
jgi:glycosyltransferase involved in cell wall biosynthesis